MNRRQRIIHAAWQATGEPPRLILGRAKWREVCRARWAVMRALRGDGLTTTNVGKIVDRDHSTVCEGLRRASELYATDSDFAALCDRVAAA